MKFLILLLALLAPAITTSVLAADAENVARTILSASDHVQREGAPTRWRYGLLAQWSRFERNNGSHHYGLRPSLGYDLTPDISIWAAYSYYLSDPDEGNRRYEHRWWQQLSWTARRWDWGTLSLRTRLEQRSYEHANDTAWRFRQRLQLTVPLSRFTAALITSFEHHTNLRDTDWGARSGFEQVRSYLGISKPVSERLTLEVGYMNQLINSRSNYTMNHMALLQFRTRL